MRNTIILLSFLSCMFTSCLQQKQSNGDEILQITLEEGFKDPPVWARPKGYWDWMNGNFDLDRLTAELEEARAQGMAGFDIFDIGAVSNPDGIVPAGPPFMGEECLEAIEHAVKESDRLGMELGLILSSSWDAGGSWIRPEHGSMALYETSEVVSGPAAVALDLPFPELPATNRAGKKVYVEKYADGMPVFYKDVAVLAVPVSGDGTIPDVSRVIDLSGWVDEKGRLTWQAPEGEWEISRFVCTNTGEMLKCPSPNSIGLSMDHFNPEATEFHFNYFIGKLQDKLGDIGSTPIRYFYLCSYEVVGFVWTPRMLEEFEERRGYDMKPYLPVLQGKTIQNEEITERFLYDYRQTLSDLLIENLYLKGREMINPYGIKLCSESGGPDFSFASRSESADLDFIHRRTAGTEIYFLSNKGDACARIEGIFRVKGKIPEYWDPETGSMQAVAMYRVDGETIRLPLTFQPHGSVFVVFREKAEEPHAVSAAFGGEPIFPLSGKDQPGAPDAMLARKDDRLTLLARKEGRYTVRDNNGHTFSLEIREIPDPIEVTGDWQISFPSGWGAPERIIIPELMSWTDSDHDGVKYFSGIATYEKKFEIPGEYLDAEMVVTLDLGKVREVVEVYLNGKNLGILWKPPYQTDITPLVKAGENTLTLEVANTWSNRLKGDGMLPEGERFTKTNITGPDYLTGILWKDAPLLESGVMGPVSLQFARKTAVQ